MIKMSKLEKALGGKITSPSDRRIPGLDDDDSGRTIYFCVSKGKSAKAVFRKIVNFANPPSAQSGGATEAGCTISPKSDLVFHALEVHGDLKGWCADVEAGAASQNILLAKVVNDRLQVQDGQEFSLEECQVMFT